MKQCDKKQNHTIDEAVYRHDDYMDELQSYRRKDIPSYRIRFLTQNEMSVVNRWEGKAFSVDDAIEKCKKIIGKNDKIVDIESIMVNGKKINDQDLNNIKFQCLSQNNDDLLAVQFDECDGGGAAGAGTGAGVGASAAAVGDSTSAAGSTSAVADISNATGISSSDVLGKCDHENGQGYLGQGCFHIPSKVCVPLHRWEIGNGGSTRKTTKKGKKKKTPYEKGMKVVVDMFNETEESSLVPVFVYGITPDKCAKILDKVTDLNPNYDKTQFMKYFSNTLSKKYECIGCFDKNTKVCLALALVDYDSSKTNESCIVEIQAFQKGFDELLLKYILSWATTY